MKPAVYIKRISTTLVLMLGLVGSAQTATDQFPFDNSIIDSDELTPIADFNVSDVTDLESTITDIEITRSNSGEYMVWNGYAALQSRNIGEYIEGKIGTSELTGVSVFRFSESPVPFPAFALLVSTALIGFVTISRRRKV